jgi:CDP-diacylglycerol--glycerol-3-phosphate 3-phosphatidyltransferase
MSANQATRVRLRHLPNAISTARIAAVPVLLYLALTGRQALFTCVLVPALLSDIADGWLARAYRLESKRGAQLDSVADTLLLFVSIFGIWTFHREVLTGNAWLCTAVITCWALENVAALLRYRRLSSFHTYVSKVAGYLLGVYVGVLFVFGHVPWLLYLAAGLSILGNLEEFALLAVLREWRADVRGLWWVLADRRRGAAG